MIGAMARPLRLEFPGAVWHVMARGNDRQAVFPDDGDREAFLDVLSRVVRSTRWRLHAYVLMPNHYHLLVETPEPNLSSGMRQLNGIYTQRTNIRHGRTGHLLQGRFKGILVERESHLLELCRYVVLNPVRAGLAPSASDWPWSSFRATAGLAPAPHWLDTRWTLEQFASSRSSAGQAYRRFVADGTRAGYSPWAAVEGQLFLGRAGFRARFQGQRTELAGESEIPKAQRTVTRPTLDAVLREVLGEYGLDPDGLTHRGNAAARKAFAWICRNETGLRLGEIAPALGVTGWAVSRLESGGESLRLKDAGFRSRLEATVSRLARANAENASGTSPRGPRKSQNKT